MIGLLGYKVGMTRIFNNDGLSIPVTIIMIKDNYITQIKNKEIDGYDAVQVTTECNKKNKLNKPQTGIYIKAGIKKGYKLHEFKLKDNTIIKNLFIGQAVKLNIFNSIKKVDITSISKGKGFSGTIKRWNFSTQDSSHGNSLSHRAPGSIGQNQTPGRVFKGKKMAGHLGNQKVTIQNMLIMGIDNVNKILLVKGSIPGYSGSQVIIKPSIKIKHT
ncbi:MAG: 50S ribosomal protein L3 [Candidatus Lightella neohaematopini]|nr:50S ribosomal protein L3 [Candidatus Lightella neohaematopini]MCV2531292.1 50S ribosomal protein L3 [Candidatus Lightella neohaematopini]